MRIFTGTTASSGLAVGPVVRIDRGMVGLHRIVSDPHRERALYDAAIVLAKDELMMLQKHAQAQEDADILMFQVALLEDESFTNEIGDYIAAGAGSAAAVERAERIFSSRIRNIDDDYLRSAASTSATPAAGWSIFWTGGPTCPCSSRSPASWRPICSTPATCLRWTAA